MSVLKFLVSKTFFKQLGLAIVAVVVIIFFLLRWLDATTNHGEFIIVPDLKGKSLETVEIELKDKDLVMAVQDSSNYNPNYPKYSVIEQDPKAGSRVKENRKIYITYNPSGYRKVEVPNIEMRTLRQARPTLEAIGLEIGELTYEDYIGKDVVLKMYHKGEPVEPGDLLPLTSVIDLEVGNGKRRSRN
ncbi:PASTA domain-containing protein [Winogradskyella aurantiaca]|uniref:PASTA domain-containing protein n=1 Tax=Winogradskyella aurantiaca TaxID=2219558 RepID=UPI000E1D9507|nr:PASTA domain-containing protein [Winogradskyella aurantiaca]